MRDHTPTPWELVEATEHHGPYIVGAYGDDVCDLYAMSNPMAASVRNGGNSFPVHFSDADANAAFIVMAVNAHDALVKVLADILEANKDFRDGMPQSWDGDPLQDACDAAKTILEAIKVPA